MLDACSGSGICRIQFHCSGHSMSGICHGHGHCHVMDGGTRRILSSQDWDLRFAASVPIPRQMVMYVFHVR